MISFESPRYHRTDQSAVVASTYENTSIYTKKTIGTQTAIVRIKYSKSSWQIEAVNRERLHRRKRNKQQRIRESGGE